MPFVGSVLAELKSKTLRGNNGRSRSYGFEMLVAMPGAPSSVLAGQETLVASLLLEF